MLDERGYFYIIDAFLAVVLILTVFLIVNTTISSPNHHSFQMHDIETAQDTMELLSGKVNFTDKTFLAEVSQILEDGENSKESIRQASKICKEKFDDFNLKNYRFTENNVLKGKILSSSGDYSKAGKVSVATRNFGDYSYSLSVW